MPWQWDSDDSEDGGVPLPPGRWDSRGVFHVTADEPQPEDPKPEDSQPKPKDPKPNQLKPKEPKPKEPKPKEPKPKEPKPKEPKPKDTKPVGPKNKPTHFLSLPLHHVPKLQDSIDQLVEEIATKFPSLKIPEGAVRPAAAAHITLGVMSLDSEEKILRAVELLKNMDMKAIWEKTVDFVDNGDSQSSGPIKFKLSLQGLATIASASKATVLFTMPNDPSNRLRRFAIKIRTKFIKEGLLFDEKRTLKLHLTLINTLYCVKENMRRNSTTCLVKLNCQDLIKEMGQRVLLEEVDIDQIAICMMGAKDKDGVTGGAGYEVLYGRSFE
ncbi:AKAP7 2'5' RNA ligase-like domain-containing protein [Pyronema domesticum]|uniref:Similar to Activating signal cointegrator 1 complex subunit 1 acc. no. Q8N9N2 n=1 Tax=Pyronema omphalodes (strain CBS 100304) TaxID=1076935 RepID=U4LRT9_PYROM|nr:AKAP7 2'5' RNA ligase-like domain-containing protein [Pyronema domesticum]CCX32050.1 Similar to Activating signal cointegrator 1 complex subunit 1; acc. no. Q8N9N2 [Pyronema omphalodes CBS 100304]